MPRRLILFTFLLLFSTTAVFGQTPADRWRVSVLASDIARGAQTFAGTEFSDGIKAGVGVAVAYAFDDRWSAELATSAPTYDAITTDATIFNGLRVPFTAIRSFRVHPVDLVATRYFATSRRISPYLRAGLRYVDAPDDPPQPDIPPFAGLTPVHFGFGLSDRFSVQAGAGLSVRLTDRTALRVEVMRLLRSEDVMFDRLTRGAAGVSWRF